MAVNYAYLIYREVNKNSPTRRLSHNDFHQLLANQLINNPYKDRQKAAEPTLLLTDDAPILARKCKLELWPIGSADDKNMENLRRKRMRCAYCTDTANRLTPMFCTTCLVPLHPGECDSGWHAPSFVRKPHKLSTDAVKYYMKYYKLG